MAAPDPSEPTWPALLERGVALHRAGDLSAAETLYRRVLQLLPTQPDAINLLGILALQTGKIESALSHARQACSLDPANASYHLSRGNALRAARQFESAAEAFSTAVALRPDYAEAHNNLGLALIDLHRHADALIAFQRAVALNPSAAMSCNNLGSALRRAGRPADAANACRAAISASPDFAPAHNNLANALLDLGQVESAIAALHESIRLDPNYADPHANLCLAEYRAGRYDAAIVAGRAAVGLAPNFAAGHWNLAHALLIRGDLAGGFAEYEWRTRLDPPITPAPPPGVPLWTSQPLAGRTILLQAEQGFGDTIQFIRYAPLLGDQGARIILECPPALFRLLAGVSGIAEVRISQMIHLGGNEGALRKMQESPDFSRLPNSVDYFCPVMSLPHRFGTALDTIPAGGPYIPVDSAPSTGDAIDVGLAWAGRAIHANDRRRSMPLSELAPLAAVPGVRLHSLQLEPAGPPLIDHSAELRDFGDTAALIARLDLVITVDTAVAHLAGAMGKPVFLMLPKVCDWRWLLDRSDSPWYPTMRLFRQPHEGLWGPVIDAIADALREEQKENLAQSRKAAEEIQEF